MRDALRGAPTALSPPLALTLPYVGLLDIFGFENFKLNSFEQLCINFANEKLQQFFLLQVFKAEEELHVKEGVPWKEVEFQDNAPCIDLLEKPPNGILRLLDSQARPPHRAPRSGGRRDWGRRSGVFVHERARVEGVVVHLIEHGESLRRADRFECGDGIERASVRRGCEQGGAPRALSPRFRRRKLWSTYLCALALSPTLPSSPAAVLLSACVARSLKPHAP
eukprot:6187383-Pleurochrysis_carterae.AAC.1